MPLLALSLLLFACNPGGRIEVPTTPYRVFDTDPIRMDLSVLDGRGQKVPDADLTFTSTSDPSILLIEKETGLPRCQTSGDALLGVEAGRVKAQVPVRCQVVASLQADPPEVRIAEKEVAMTELSPVITVLDVAGQPITDVPIRFESLDLDIARVSSDGRIRAVAPGFTTVRATVARKSIEIPVFVGEVVGKLDVAMGGKFPLPAGDIEIRLVGGTGPVKVHLASGTPSKGLYELTAESPIRCTLPSPVTAQVTRQKNAPGRLVAVAWPKDPRPARSGNAADP